MQVVLPLVCPTEFVKLAVDDTTAQRWGRSIAFAAYFRDAARSTRTRDIMHWSHNWVVACLLIRLPFWPTRVLSLPIWAGLYRREEDCKDSIVFKTRLELALEMIRKVREWIPQRKIGVVADGAYTSKEIIRLLPERVHFGSRTRREAAFNAPPPAKRRTLPPLHAMLLDFRLAEWRRQISCLSLSKANPQLIEYRLGVALASVP